MSANIRLLFNEKIKQLINKLLFYVRKLTTSDLLFLLTFILLSAIIFFFPIQNLDELWNYNFAKCISDGMTPYKDFSMLQTPLASYLAAIFVSMFGGGIFSFRLAAFILLSGTQIVYYFLCLKITKSKAIAFTLTSLILALSLLCFYYNYNNLSLCFVLLILLLKNSRRESFKNNIIEGFLFGFLPLIKQSTGLILLSVFLMECFYKIFVRKKAITINVVSALISLIPGIIFVVSLFLTDNFKWFYEYAVLGVSTFTHRMNIFEFLFSDPLSFVFGIGTVIIVCYVIFIVVKTKTFFYKRTMCFIISLAWFFSVTYPIFDVAHYIVGIIPLIAIFFLFFDFKHIKKTDRVILYVLSCSILILSCVSVIPIGNEYKVSDLNNYEGIPINIEVEANIKAVNSYIMDMSNEDKEVLIADATAAIYNIPVYSYKKHWDMLLVGNVGMNTAADLLNENPEAVILVLNDEMTLNKQSHFELIQHIKKNYKKIDEVLYFDVYTK